MPLLHLKGKAKFLLLDQNPANIHVNGTCSACQVTFTFAIQILKLLGKLNGSLVGIHTEPMCGYIAAESYSCLNEVQAAL